MLKRNRIRSLSVLCAFAPLMGATTAMGESGWVVGKVQRTLVHYDDTFGGCMALMSPSPHSVLPGCKPDWVSFDCGGTRTDPVRAYRMLDQAQLALTTGKTARLWVTDSTKFNGYCWALRIDVDR